MSDLWPRLGKLDQDHRCRTSHAHDRADDCGAALQDSSASPDDETFLTGRGLTRWPADLPRVVLACAAQITLLHPSRRPLTGPPAPRCSGPIC